MKLLLDQNLSPRLVQALAAAHPGSAHVREFGLQAAQDAEIWDFAKDRGYAVVSKDSDFRQRSFLLGAPPKVVWVHVGNCTTDRVLDVLTAQPRRLEELQEDAEAAFLVLE